MQGGGASKWVKMLTLGEGTATGRLQTGRARGAGGSALSFYHLPQSHTIVNYLKSKQYDYIYSVTLSHLYCKCALLHFNVKFE